LAEITQEKSLESMIYFLSKHDYQQNLEKSKLKLTWIFIQKNLAVKSNLQKDQLNQNSDGNKEK